jgi:Ca-activated chloride channel family protein
MNNIVLQRPEYLWAVLAALLLIVAWRRFRRRRRFVAFPLAKLLVPRIYRASRLRQLPILIAAAVLPFVAIALTEPVLPYSERQVTSRGIDIALVLDLSSSMQEPMGMKKGNPTRLETTKRALIDFVARRPDDRIGLVVFSDYPYVVSPLTFDHQYLRDYVSMIDDQTLVEEGLTAIGDGIATASALLARMKLERDPGRQVMVVFTDGEHNFGVDPLIALAAADEAGTRVHMVGIDLNEVVKTRVAVLELTRAVRGYGGRYFDATSAAQLQAASASIDSLEKGSLVQTRYVRNRPVFHYFVIPAVVLLCAVFAMRAVPYFIDIT